VSSTNLPSNTTWMETWVEPWLEWLTLLLLHCVFLAVISMAVGLFLEAALGRYWVDTGLEPFAPMIALVALLTGYFAVSPGKRQRAAAWTWTVGVLWLAFGIYDTAWGSDAWNPMWSNQKTRLAYVIANLFSSTNKCRDSECIGELIFTIPFTASVMYSIGAFIKIRRLAKRLRTSKDFSPSC
jgi:hypothetical protein